MPIPTSDLQKQIQTPNPKEGRAVNFADQAYAHLQAMNDDIVKSGNLLAKGLQLATTQYVNVKRQASDDAAKKAFNEYEVTKDDLNTKLQSLEGQDAVDFYYGDYTKEINKAHGKLTATLDALPDKDIAEAYRDKTNQINLQNRGFSFLAAKRQENVVRDADHKAFLQNVSLEHVNDLVTAPKGVNRYDYAAGNAYNDINQANTEYLASKGLATPEMIKAANQEAMTKFAGEMVRNVANAANWDGAKTGEVYQNEILPAVKSLQKYVSPAVYQKLLEDYAHEAISTDAALRPKDFIDPKTGEINKDFLNKNYYGLTPWQKTRAISAVQAALSKGHNASLSDEEKHWLKQYQDQKYINFKARMADAGLMSSDEYRILQAQKGLSKEEIAEMRKDAIRNFDLSEALDMLVEMQEMLDKKVTLPTGREGFFDDDRIISLANDMKQYIELYTQGYNNQLKERPGFLGRLTDYILGEDMSVKQAALHDLIKSQQEREGYTNSRVQTLDLMSALYSMSKQMSQDKSVNWDASADSKEGYGNPAIREKIKNMGTAALAEPGGQIDVFGKSSFQNMAGIANQGKVVHNEAQEAYDQWMKRMQSGAPQSSKILYGVGGVNYDRGISVRGVDYLEMVSQARKERFALTPLERYNLEQKLSIVSRDFFNSIVEGKMKLEEEEQKEIDIFNGGFAK